MNNVDYLLSTKAIRERAARIYELTERGDGQFALHPENLDKAADIVIDVINAKYPSWKIPYHSRWGHFKVGGKDRVQTLLNSMTDTTPADLAKTMFDLVIVSVLLDAGAGPAWQYQDLDGDIYTRSEGLAVASFEMFTQGKFSSDTSKPWRADSDALLAMTADKIAEGFQVTAEHPLLGVNGRAELLKKLGDTLTHHSTYFGQGLLRPGNLFDYLMLHVRDGKIEASQILDAVLRGLGPIWPGRIALANVNLGDCWQHDESLVPFHKLSQWLTYSLLEPMELAGIQVVNLDALTPLAEYRNGGFIIDAGLISAKDPDAYTRQWAPDSKLVIQWRALTIVLIEKIADRIRAKKHYTAETLPLAKVLEGGTWWAGRKLAQEKRGGKPPIDIKSDGTVF
jgi:Protein of unknown function (DUF1688)